MSLGEALELRARCDYRGALEALRGAEDAASLVERSRLHEDFGDYDSAWDDAERSGDRVRMAGVAAARRDPEHALRLLEGLKHDPAVAERASALRGLAQLDESETLFRGVTSDDARVRLIVLAGLADVARDRGHYDEADRRFRDAIAYADEHFGAASIEVGGCLNGLGMVCKYAGRFDEGIAVYRRALEIVERAFGITPDVASLYHNLGGLEHARRNFEEAELYARRSVELRRESAGPDDPAVAEDEAAWAATLLALGRHEEAARLLRHALDVLEGSLGADHPEVAGAWNNLASALQKQGALEEAKDAYERALAAKERVVGAGHPSVAITLNNLAVNARKRELPGEAEPHYRRALAILEESVEGDHPNRLLVLRNYAKLLRSLGREEEADDLERRREESAAHPRPEKTTDTVGRTPMSTEDVEAHGWGANTNEDAAEDPSDRDRLSSNTNEDVSDDDVEAHGWGSNTNEDAADDAEARDRLAGNTNEDLADDVEAHGWGTNTNEDAADDTEARDRLASNTNEEAVQDD